jgi:hypothetical protein
MSSLSTLSVTGKYPTFTTLSSAANAGDYSLDANVFGGGKRAVDWFIFNPRQQQ